MPMFRKVKVTLADADVLIRGKKLAEERIECNAMEARLNAFIEEHKATKKIKEDEIAKAQKRIDKLAREIEDKETEADVEVRHEYDVDHRMVLTLRADNGQELTEERREMSMAEIRQHVQGSLPFDGDEPEKDGDDDHSEKSEASETVEHEGQNLVKLDSRRGKKTGGKDARP